MSKSKNDQKISMSKKTVSSLDFLTIDARLAFIKAIIFYYFNLECCIKIEIDTTGYVIGVILI